MHHPEDDTISNPSSNESFESILERNLSRRQVLKGGLGAAAVAMFGPPLFDMNKALAGTDSAGLIGFTGISPSTADTVRVPAGYSAQVLYRWGDPASAGPAFLQDASNSAADQMVQAGMHHDGMHFFPFPKRGAGRSVQYSSDRGLMCINHEYTDDGLLHPGGMSPWTAEKVAKSKAAHGVSVIEVRMDEDGEWKVKRPSAFARRITGDTPIRISGPVAGSDWVRTLADPAGLTVLGTLNNCAHGYTPWGTYLTCEENWNGYFVNRSGAIPAEQRRYGISANGFGYRWHEHDERFDAARHPNEPNRFGWVVEIDPFQPQSRPVKRTALGRIKHEGAIVTLARDQRVVVYTGDDERFEYIYKFVSRDAFDARASSAAHNRDLLDHGTLYVARFNADGGGEWVALEHGRNGLTAGNGFSSQAEVLVKTRQAADRVGATKMDRPEWIAVHPVTGEVYCTLTNNSRRGAAGQPATDAANPRANNVYGHIIRWRESGADNAALSFQWDVFVLCGDPANADPAKRGNIVGDIYGSPDGLWFDDRGVLWIQTDVSTSTLNRGDYANMGNNQMLACDPATGETRRFLTGPRGCEVTGVVATPDGKNLFVNLQHPGETAAERGDPANPKAVSAWPDGEAGGRPRSATVVIRRDDGGVIGS